MDYCASYRLSRFVWMQPGPDGFVIHNPFNCKTITLNSPQIFRILLLFTKRVEIGALLGRFKEPEKSLVEKIVTKCIECKLLTEVDAEKGSEEDSFPLQQWEFHDLLFHSRSRIGRHSNPIGGTYRFLHKTEPLPAVHDDDCEYVFPLYVPDMNRLESEDYPFSLVLENRASVRTYGDSKITIMQLAEFLYRSCRAKKVFSIELTGQSSQRAYPSGGASYPLEIYVIARHCNGLRQGMYHYNPQKHRLAFLVDFDENVQLLLRDAKQCAGLDALPPILFCVTARFQRTSWKYESIAYSLILKEVGAVFQTMYLVATAMDLAPCALGVGNSDLFSATIKNNYYAETTVGEFILGSKP